MARSTASPEMERLLVRFEDVISETARDHQEARELAVLLDSKIERWVRQTYQLRKYNLAVERVKRGE